LAEQYSSSGDCERRQQAEEDAEGRVTVLAYEMPAEQLPGEVPSTCKAAREFTPEIKEVPK